MYEPVTLAIVGALIAVSSAITGLISKWLQKRLHPKDDARVVIKTADGRTIQVGQNLSADEVARLTELLAAERKLKEQEHAEAQPQPRHATGS
jgi:hypothetical protein